MAMATAKRWLVVVILTLLLPAKAFAADGASIIVDRAWARASILASRPGAAYLTIRNVGTNADRLVGATSPVAKSVTIHATDVSGGTMRMRAVSGLEVGTDSEVVLEPGGIHLMLMGLREKLVEGEDLTLVLTFERAGVIELQVPIRSFAARNPDGSR
ncbi:MAG: copper chaperone PCu(A)C [Alphaproteobacteria bacterium]